MQTYNLGQAAMVIACFYSTEEFETVSELVCV